MDKQIILDFLQKKYPSLEPSYREFVVDKFFQIIAQKLKSANRVEIRNFGVFRLKELDTREIYNPHTATYVKVPGKRIPTFKCSKILHKLG